MKAYFYLFSYVAICAISVSTSSKKLKYENPFKKKSQWNDAIEKFIHKYQHSCTNDDLASESPDTDETQQRNNIPKFSSCNLSERDFQNIYKIVQLENSNDKGANLTLTGCRALPQKEDFNIFNITVICRNKIKGKCRLLFDHESLILPGTEIEYVCKPGFIFFDPSNWTKKKSTCKDDVWSPQIETCRNISDLHKYRMNWDKPEIWKPPLFVSECGNSTIKSPAKSAVPVTSPDEFPWHVFVYNRTHYPICGASIISTRYIISAAHCFKDGEKDFSNFYMIAGKIKHDIESIMTPNYALKMFKYQNNIAIIRTQDEITYNKNVSPICLINEYFPYIPKGEVPLMTVIWSGADAKKGNLKLITASFRSYYECIKQQRERNKNINREVYENFSHEKFCAVTKSKTRTISINDSGSGLVMKGPNGAYFLVGIVHYPSDLPEISPYETMCTYVPLFHHWILETIYLKETENKRILAH